MLCEVLCRGNKLTRSQLCPFTGDVGMADYLALNEMTNRFAGRNRSEFIKSAGGKIEYLTHCIEVRNMDNIYDMYSFGFDAYIRQAGGTAPTTELASGYNMLFAVLLHLSVRMIRESL